MSNPNIPHKTLKPGSWSYNSSLILDVNNRRSVHLRFTLWSQSNSGPTTSHCPQFEEGSNVSSILHHHLKCLVKIRHCLHQRCRSGITFSLCWGWASLSLLHITCKHHVQESGWGIANLDLFVLFHSSRNFIKSPNTEHNPHLNSTTTLTHIWVSFQAHLVFFSPFYDLQRLHFDSLFTL